MREVIIPALSKPTAKSSLFTSKSASRPLSFQSLLCLVDIHYYAITPDKLAERTPSFCQSHAAWLFIEETKYNRS